MKRDERQTALPKVGDLSLEEKFRLLAGKDLWRFEDLGGKLPPVVTSDGPLGLRTHAAEAGNPTIPAVAFPSSEVLAQTWDPALAYRTGNYLADECIERNVDILLAPGVNLKRTPVCGRNFEYFSEDPLLAGLFGREYIRGVQDKFVGTSLKHFCANNLEYGRHWVSSEVDERTLRELYLKPFEIACEADPTTVMCSYNALNGVLVAQNAKLFRILRGEMWREDGVVISDWSAVKAHAASVRAGLDVEMPYSDGGLANLRAAYERGEITEEEIDACVERVLKLIARLAEWRAKRKVESTVEERLAAAQKVAEEGIVLLKNNGVLPIAPHASVSVVCPREEEYYAGRGSSRVEPGRKPAPLSAELRAALPGASVEAAELNGWMVGDKLYAPAIGKDVAVIVCGVYDGEGSDRRTLRLDPEDEQLIRETAALNPNTVVVLCCGAAIDVSPWIDGVAAVVSAGYAGERWSAAVAAVLSGKVNPSGKLAETFAKQEDYRSERSLRNHIVTLYEEGLRIGYRDFDGHPADVAFPFGYGLSYSEFEYSGLRAEREGDGVSVVFRLRNVSARAGKEVAQVYVRELTPCVWRPYKELKGFEKVALEAGEEREVRIFLPRSAFSYFSVAHDAWRVNGGAYELLVAADARDVKLRTTVRVEGD